MSDVPSRGVAVSTGWRFTRKRLTANDVTVPVPCTRPGGIRAIRWKKRTSPSFIRDASTGSEAKRFAQCHLHGAAVVELRGRRLSDFRPGLALTDFAVPYGLESPSETMQVVGHMEQMRLSPCFQKSGTLTCTTCHNPHRTVAPSERMGHYRRTCLQCHEESTCGLAKRNRVQIRPNDDCVACHMPESPTEIPHFAFTHHRIGIHDPRETPSSLSAPQRIVPLADVSPLSSLDRDRNLGLAYMQVADLPEHLHNAVTYHSRARSLLENVFERGMRDPAALAALARLSWQRDEERTILFAESVLESASASPDDRATALFTLATTRVQQGRIMRAVPLLKELVTIRRYADAWHVLSLCREDLGDTAGAISASVKAAQISPVRPEFQERLVHLYRKTHRPEMVERHQKRLQQLENFLKER